MKFLLAILKSRLGDYSDVCIFIRKVLNVTRASFGGLYNPGKFDVRYLLIEFSNSIFIKFYFKSFWR